MDQPDAYSNGVSRIVGAADKSNEVWAGAGSRSKTLRSGVTYYYYYFLAHKHKACRQLKIKQEMTAVGD